MVCKMRVYTVRNMRYCVLTLSSFSPLFFSYFLFIPIHIYKIIYLSIYYLYKLAYFLFNFLQMCCERTRFVCIRKKMPTYQHKNEQKKCFIMKKKVTNNIYTHFCELYYYLFIFLAECGFI